MRVKYSVSKIASKHKVGFNLIMVSLATAEIPLFEVQTCRFVQSLARSDANFDLGGQSPCKAMKSETWGVAHSSRHH